MYIKLSIRTVSLLIFLISALFLFAFYYFVGHVLFAKIVPGGAIGAMDYRTQTYSTPSEAGVLLDDLKKAGIDRLKGEEQVLATLRWTMNQASAIGDATRLNVPELLDYARRGGPMACNDMGLVFSEALSALGIPSRRIVLARNIFDKYDVHATVEAWVDGKWRLYDPTFNVSPVSNGEVIGAFEAREIFFHGNWNIEFRFFGDVRYPARLENYYMRYKPLFNNAFVVAREDVFEIPPAVRLFQR